MPSRSRRIACYCLACAAAVSSGRIAKADPDETRGRSSRSAAIVNQPLGEEAHPRLAKGDSGPSVVRLQTLLDNERHARNATAISKDGDFGEETLTAVKAFQQRHGLPVTGVVDDATWKRLEAAEGPGSRPPVEEPRGARPGADAPASTPARTPARSETPSAPSRSIGAVGALDKGVKPQHDAMKLSATALDWLARIVESEAGVCSEEGKIAVAAVVLNRVRGGFADGTVQGVIKESGQFTSYGDATFRGKPSQASIAAAQAAAAGEDPTHGATYYYNPYLVHPYWAKGMTVLARIGTSAVNTHVFLKP